jgi:thiamine biosynthesis lipoprotein
MKPAEGPPARIAFEGTGPVPAVLRFSHAAMATTFEVLCVHEDAAYAQQAAHAAFGLVDRLEQELSRFVANSDVSRVSALRAGETTRVSPETLECLGLAQNLLELTRGAFDVSIGTGLDRLELVADDFSVRAHADGIRLDLGGLGKGYAVDRMAELLEEWEIRSTLVHGGFSSVLALAPPPGREGWSLTLSDPWAGHARVLARIEARQLALSASGTRKGTHIVSPGTGRAAAARAAWAALHRPPRGPMADAMDPAPPRPSAMAEGLSTAFMLLPVPDIEDLCRQWPEIEAWLATEPAGGPEPEATLLHF